MKASEENSFEAKYPNITKWVSGCGRIEIGYCEYTGSFARAVNMGGDYWEGEAKYPSMEDALQALDSGIKELLDEIG